MRHHTNDLSFERPDWLVDRTHHLLSVSEEGPSAFNIVLSRTPVERETLDEIADRIATELAATIEGFVAGPRQNATVAGRPALILQCEWTQNGQHLYQRQAVLIADTPEGRVLHQITATASGDAKQRHTAAFPAVLASLRLRGDEGDARDEPARPA